MSKKPITEQERILFIEACKNNGVIIAKQPQTKIASATITVGNEKISISKGLAIKRISVKKRKKNLKNFPAKIHND